VSLSGVQGLVVAVGVEGKFAEDVAGDGVDDADIEVEDEQAGRGGQDSGGCLSRRLLLGHVRASGRVPCPTHGNDDGSVQGQQA